MSSFTHHLPPETTTGNYVRRTRGRVRCEERLETFRSVIKESPFNVVPAYVVPV